MSCRPSYCLVRVWALVIMINGVDGGFPALPTPNSAKFRVADFHPTSRSQPSWVILAHSLNIIPYVSDQSVVQRYQTTRDEASARRPCGPVACSVPASLLFFDCTAPGPTTVRTHPNFNPPRSSTRFSRFS